MRAWRTSPRSGPGLLGRYNAPADFVETANTAGLPGGGPAVGALAPDALPEVILIGTGSEVQLCVEVYEGMTQEGIRARVVSMPSFELFEQQDGHTVYAAAASRLAAFPY